MDEFSTVDDLLNQLSQWQGSNIPSGHEAPLDSVCLDVSVLFRHDMGLL